MMKYLLDEIKGCVGAWGITRLRRDFVGGPIRLRRASDNAEIDVPGCGKGICSSTIGKHLSVTVTNLFGTDGNFQSDSNTDGLGEGWTAVNVGTKSMANNTQMFTPSAQYGRIVKTTEVRNQSVGDIMYLCAYIKSASNQTILTLYNGSADVLKAHTGSNQFEFLSCRGTLANISTPYTSITSTAASGWTEISVQNAKLINLTKVFGAGNEPTTAYMDSLVQSSSLEDVTNGYVTTLRDTSQEKYVKLVNMLGTDGNFQSDSNSDGLADGWNVSGTFLSKSMSNNVQSFTVDSTASGIETIISPINNNVYYFCGFVKSSNPNVYLRMAGGGVVSATSSNSHSGNGQYEFLSLKVTGTSVTSIYTKVYDTNTGNWKQIDVKQLKLFNLTTIFGVGGEPTQSQMDTMVQRALAEGYFTEKNVIRPTDAITVSLSNQPKWSNGIKFDGLDDYFMIPNYPEIDFLNAPMTAVAVFKYINATQYVFAKNGVGYDDVQYAMVVTGGGYLAVYFKGTTPAQFAIPTAYINKDIVMVFRWYIDRIDIYVNGEFIGTYIVPYPLISRPNFSIGRRTSSAYYTDRIHALMLFDRVLTEIEIKKITKYFIGG